MTKGESTVKRTRTNQSSDGLMARWHSVAKPLQRVLGASVLIGTAVTASLAFGALPASAQTTTTVTTSLSDGTNTGATLTENENTPVTDSATLTGDNAATATGSVTYTVYSDSGCTTSAADGGTVTVTAGSVPDSNPVSLATPGTYYWQASYSGDGNNDPATSTCGDETETVSPPAATAVTTTLSDGTNSGTALTEPENTPVTDSASLTGDNATTATGTVTYTVYSDSACTTAVNTGTPETITTPGTLPASAAVSLSAIGTYYWQASYSGDSANAPSASTCGSETETVTPATTTVSTTLAHGAVLEGTSDSDSATLSGDNAATATGTVTYTVYSDSGCTTAVNTGTPETITTPGTLPGSAPVTLATPGAYYWQAAYSGDANNAASVNECGSEVETVFAPGSTVTTTTVTANPSTTATGGSVTFTATVSPSKEGHPPVNATGTVSFTVTGHDGTPVSCETSNSRPLTAAGIAKCIIPAGVLLGANSPYTATAVYSGDMNFAASSTTSPATVTVAARKSKTKLAAHPRKPVSHGTESFTAAVSSRGAGAPVAGSVVFSVSSTDHKHAKKFTSCQGGDVQPVVSGVATCNMKAGWFIVPGPTKKDPNPKASWSVSADYLGNANFSSSHGALGGTEHG